MVFTISRFTIEISRSYFFARVPLVGQVYVALRPETAFEGRIVADCWAAVRAEIAHA